MADAAVTTIRRDEALPADPMVNMIERLVLNPDADLDKLERMLAMKERMEAQAAKVSFARALSEARSNIPPIIKDATVDFTSAKGRTHYKHETLAGIAKVIDPILSEHGISYRFRTDQGQGGVRVTCIVQHSDGHAEETTLVGAPDQSGNKNGFQAVGSAVTYLQRYTLKAALGLSAEVDDDAQAATPREAPRQEQRPRFDAQAEADRIKGEISKRTTRDDLAALWTAERGALSQMPEAVLQDLTACFKEAVAKLSPPADTTTEAPAEDRNADLGDDEIPY